DRFIAAYTNFLGTLVSKEVKRGKLTSRLLAIGRRHYAADRTLLDAFRQAHPQADGEMLDAIAGMKIGRWLYLKDTRSYSVLLDEQTEAAYGVLGLNDPLRMLTRGQSGAVFYGGVMALQGRWVCDGLLENPVWLGSNMRRGFNARYTALRACGAFSVGAAG
ncbi:hypothetical protein, partial [Craterilacuibacter sp.]|uniref:hypothetical protein n=1 Tax=Craterilacuibacter sp. TaxID=2870909 RepID=UPI003F3BA90A